MCRHRLGIHTGMAPKLTTAVAIVWGTEDGDHILIMTPIVAFHHKLMRSGYKAEPIGVIELLRNVLAKCVTSASW